ncbi:MAG: hypothetical protein R6U98_13875, partial [Pirellulaceae bacterium]
MRETEVSLAISIRNVFGTIIMHFSSREQGALLVGKGETDIRMRVDRNILNEGRYYATVWLGDSR